MTKITEEQRAELLASNASRDVVEAVLARLDAAEKLAHEGAVVSYGFWLRRDYDDGHPIIVELGARSRALKAADDEP